MDKNETREIRDRFYDWASKELKLSVQQVRKILKDGGHTSFIADELASYRSLLKHYVDIRDGLSAKLAMAQNAADEIANAMKCHVPGCTGTIQKNTRRSFGWGETCTVGGDVHPIAVRTAMLAMLMRSTGGRDLNQMITYLLDEREKRLHEETLKESEPEATYSQTGDEPVRDIPELGQTERDDSADTGPGERVHG